MGGICRFAEQITTFSWLGGAPNHFVIIPTDCSASLSQSYKHSESANLLRKLLLPHDWAVPKKTGSTPCKHGYSLSFCNLVSSSPALSHAQNRPIGLTRCFAAVLLIDWALPSWTQIGKSSCKHEIFLSMPTSNLLHKKIPWLSPGY